MTPERWRQIKEIVSAALDQDESRRDAWIAGTCAGDESLREEVMSLLAAHEGPPSFIDTPLMERAIALAEPATQASWIGRTLGPYRLVEEIGRGGMGIVFKAVRIDADFEQHVAIKLLHHSPDTGLLLSRFRRERQILARLSHPNIAHLLDGGSTAAGLPYLVMEYVKGEPIDAYCERMRLGPDERLRLFRTLCEAVHYVHRHLMVHGDLKCSNVLVNEEGVVKLLDFGIAKLLDPSPTTGTTHLRFTGMLGLTPEYASPEQMRGEPVTTASDVYSLGVLLYRLLTLRLPYASQSGGYYDIARQICDEPPRRPSLVVAEVPDAPVTVHQMRGDLEVILLKALKKAPEERYASVEQFSQDIGNYLGGFPVLAVPESTRYRLRKFVERNRPLVAAGALVVASLIVGILATSWQAHLARTERQRAERHFEDVHRFAQTLLLDVHDSMTPLPGTEQARETIINSTLKYLDGLLRENEANVEVRRDLARAYERISDLQGSLNGHDLQATRASAESLRKGLQLLEGLWIEGLRETDLLRDRFRAHLKLSQLLLSGNEVEESARHARFSLDIASALVRMPGATKEDDRLMANAYVVQGTLEGLTGSLDAGLELLQKALAIYEKHILAGDTSMTMRRSYVIACSRLGKLLAYARRYEESYEVHLRGLGMLESMLAENPQHAELRSLSAYQLMSAGGSAARSGNAPEALRLRRESVNRQRALAEADLSREGSRFNLAEALADYADSLRDGNDLAGAESLFNEAQSLLRSLPGAQSPELNSTRLMIAEIDLRLGQLYLARAHRQARTRPERHRMTVEACTFVKRGTDVLRRVDDSSLQKHHAQEHLASAADAIETCETVSAS